MTILAIAYSCEPNRGSEAGAGWDWVRILSSFEHTCVITRENNARVIEPALSRLPERDRLSFIYVDLPQWARSWKKGQRGARVYYLLWQIAAVAKARSLVETRGVNIVWHLTVANLWMGSLAAALKRPFVFGPAGVGLAAPMGLLPSLGFRGAVHELALGTTTAVARYLNPAARWALRRADLILAQNSETLAWIPARYRNKTVIFPSALPMATPPPRRERLDNAAPTMLYAGQLLPLKGVHFAILALERLPEWQFIICGAGPDEGRLRRLAERVNVLHRIDFRGWVDQNELWRVMRQEADVLVLPSLHEGAPRVVIEAGEAGLPVISLDRGGARLLGAYSIPTVGSLRVLVDALADAISRNRTSHPTKLPARSEEIQRLGRILAHQGLISGGTLQADDPERAARKSP